VRKVVDQKTQKNAQKAMTDQNFAKGARLAKTGRLRRGRKRRTVCVVKTSKGRMKDEDHLQEEVMRAAAQAKVMDSGKGLSQTKNGS